MKLDAVQCHGDLLPNARPKLERQNLFERGVSSKSEMNETTEPLFSVSAQTRGNPIHDKKIGLASLVAAIARLAHIAQQELPA
ncbi:MAG: hypothetical protein HC853_07355 [Anaerolineae bacterium]|nr:hypothetical protein [Anaerolineae bacterium]